MSRYTIKPVFTVFVFLPQTFYRLKNRLFLLLCLLWLFNSLGAVTGSGNAVVYIKVPSNINTRKYSYQLSTRLVTENGAPFGGYKPKIEQPGQIIRCEVWGGYTLKYEDTLLDIQFSVHGSRWQDHYVHYQARLHIIADSVYVIPELPTEDVVDSMLHEEGKANRKEHRWENFKSFATDWKSYFLYVNFHQGNRLYGEVSFSNARYNQVTPFRYWFKRYHPEVPGFIRGPVYGAEFNFLWQKEKFILGPKIGFQITNRVVNLGLSGVYYTDFTHGLFCLKPRIGINPLIPWVNFSYEYAIRCGPNHFGNRINRHQFSMYFLIPLRLKETDPLF